MASFKKREVCCEKGRLDSMLRMRETKPVLRETQPIMVQVGIAPPAFTS